MAYIQRLPYEIVSYVVSNLSLDDLFNLSQTCKHFGFLLKEDSICRAIIKREAPGSAEAQRADTSPAIWPYPRALRTVMKRRRAIAEADPYLVAVVGICDSFKYSQGTLLYVLGNELRIFDLHSSSTQEVVVDIQQLLRKCLADYDDDDSDDYDFKVVHYACGIVSCLYSIPEEEPAGTLVVFKPSSAQVLFTHYLPAKYRLFVRNDREHLCYGTHSGIGADGHRRWELGAYKRSRRTDSWIPMEFNISFDRFRGTDINSNISFEIINNHFYAISSVSAFHVREFDFNAYFSCLRFPLHKPTHSVAQITFKGHMWRRNHREGPIDDRWSGLRIEENEDTRQIEVLESRKEWVFGRNKLIRTHYRKPLALPPADADWDEGEDEPEYYRGSLQSTGLRKKPRCTTSTTDYEDDETPSSRDPHMVHHSDNGLSLPQTHRTFVRAYYSSCQSFLDFVNDPSSREPGQQRLRIRIRSRKLKKGQSPSVDGLQTNDAIGKLYDDQGTTMWPRYAEGSEKDPRNQQLHGIMNRVLGKIHGTSDDRSLVYSTGGGDEKHVLVLISFDPSIRLENVPAWNGRIKVASNTTPGAQQSAYCRCGGVRVPSTNPLRPQTGMCTNNAPVFSAHGEMHILNYQSCSSVGAAIRDCWVKLERPLYTQWNIQHPSQGFDLSA